MRICFDRLCFARQRPASSDNTPPPTTTATTTTTNSIANDATFKYNHNLSQTNNVNKTTISTTAPTTNVITTTPSSTISTTTTIPTTSTNRIEINIDKNLNINHRSVASVEPTDGALILNALDLQQQQEKTHSIINNNSKQTNSIDIKEIIEKNCRVEEDKEVLEKQTHSELILLNSLRKQETNKKVTELPTPTSTKNIILEKHLCEKAEIFPQKDKTSNLKTTKAPDAPNAATELKENTKATKAEENVEKEQNLYKNNQDHHLEKQHQQQQNLNVDVCLQQQPELRHSLTEQSESKASLPIIVSESKEEEQIAKMQQEPNANIQFQPDLGLVNNNNLPALSGTLIDTNNPAGIRLSLPIHPADVLTHTLIYGTVPTGAQQLNNDLQTRNILHQQELQLQQRYQQLQQLQAQTQGLFAHSPTGNPIVIQPTASGQPSAVYPSNDYCAQQQKYNLAAQMQGLCISNQSNTPPSNSIMDPTAGGVNLLSSSYVPATAQEERLIQIIHAKDLKIQEMQRALQYKDTEIAELKSHLDKFQSVFPFSRSGATTPCGGVGSGAAGGATGGVRKSGQSFQRQRAQGISAEPQSESSVLLDNVTFPKYDKDDK